MAFDGELAQRIRDALGSTPFREVKMFGGLSFLVNDKMIVSASRGGDLLVRCDPHQVDELLARDAVTWAEMRGKPMKKGWLMVEIESLDDVALACWLDTALRNNPATLRKPGSAIPGEAAHRAG